MKDFLEAILHMFCLKGIKARQEYYANLCLTYLNEAVELISSKNFFTQIDFQILKADHRLAKNCAKAAKDKLDKELYSPKMQCLERFFENNKNKIYKD